MTIPKMKTADGYLITDGMSVWDYDLERVTVDLARFNISNYMKEPDPLGQYWFDVKTESGDVKIMSDTRVCVIHPFTGEKA
jgi:hypothetical protein